MAESLLELFDAAVERDGNAVALVEPSGRRVSFAELQARARALAAGWAERGLGPGDRVLIALPLGADLYASLAGLWTIGAVAVLPEPAMGLAGLRHAARLEGIKGFCAGGGYQWLRFLAPELWGLPHYSPRGGAGGRHSLQPRAQDLALISFTSGTTGAPKAIGRSHAFLMAQQAAVAPLLQSTDHEVDLVAFPVFVLVNLAAGRTSVLPNWRMRRADRVRHGALAARIEAEGVTRALLPPALCEILAQGAVPAGLSALFTGGWPVFPDLLARLRAAAPGLRIVSVYGSTEAEPIAEMEAGQVSPDDLAAMAAGGGLLAGRPVAGLALRIEAGEIWVAGAHVNDGYLDSARDGETKVREGATVWHRTGDAGYLDAGGRLWLLGRLGAEVVTGARRLHPFAVETSVRLWPGVRRAALAKIEGRGVLVIEGEAVDLEEAQLRAAALGIADVRIVRAIPMDSRHRSKVDLRALERMLV